MSKRKKHGYAERLKYMHMLEKGQSISSVHNRYGISSSLLKVLWTKYQVQGRKALKKSSYTMLSLEEKVAAITDFEINKLSLNDVLLKYNISAGGFDKWRKRYHESGIAGLKPQEIGRPSGYMGRPRKKTLEEMTELERLRCENEYLKAENALLKKVRALVEERESHLRENGQKPSKN